ncbi:family 78 glycoside hydrolase catalytic domain [Mangrovibacterium sp.]|uniref:family 78 glycoside hydrolase catalytic domain n=1 Tax=Mangrovibacterium sp. TaxID=1961364 RepID=UPI003567F03A
MKILFILHILSITTFGNISKQWQKETDEIGSNLSHLPESQNQDSTDWRQAVWIGYTTDNRPREWAGRDMVFNQPPSDINTWNPTQEELKTTFKKSYPSPLLRKRFRVSKSIESAEVRICGLGLHELYLNGNKVGDRVLDPAQTSYDKRAFYVVHDVSEKLQHGDNAIGIMLGNGFFGQNVAFRSKLEYGTPRALLSLKIAYSDGSIEIIVSDNTWKAQNGPVLFDNIYHGETYDARREVQNWSMPDFDDSVWDSAETLDAPTSNLLEQEMEPMRKIREVEPIAVLPAERGWIIDMGQNMTGWLQLKVKEPKGTAIKMQFAELLMPDGKNIDPASTGIHVTGDVQTDIYICKGEGLEEWEPRFTYHGFRYVQITGLSTKPNLDDFTGWLVRTDVDRIGTFECSDELINKFYDVSMWTIEDNLQGLLSDCPHRERCAWLGDAYAVAEAVTFNFDLTRFWRKVSADMQTVLGESPAHFKDDFPYDPRTPSNIAVGKRLCLQARPDWGAATVMVPWYSYVYNGDKEIVRNAWSMMVGWMAYVDEKVQKEGIIDGGYGDWCPPGGNAEMDTPPALTSTALYYQSLLAMHKMGLVLGETDAALDYAKKAEFVKEAFNSKYFDAANNSFGSQTGNAFALFSQLVPKANEQAVADKLATIIMTDHKGHYNTGIFGHRPLYTMLNDFGHADVTHHLWTITDYPSLGFMTEKHDLTTWPETPNNWPEGKRYYRNSFNHPMNSGFAASFHESLGGIRPDADHPGFKHFFLKPCFLPDLEWVKVSYRSPHGLIKSSWKREEGVIIWSVTVPENTSADVQLGDYTNEQIKLNRQPVEDNRITLNAGQYQISISQ